ncbi:MAG: peptidoglycan DD-metalloendopeptidase family protein [Vicinamibacterales bacterium]
MVKGLHCKLATVVLLCALCAPGGPGVLARAPSVSQPAGATSQRAADRLQDLQREADELATREKSLLADLRRLEIQRQLKGEELTRIEQDLRKTEDLIAAANARASALRASAETERPGVEARLVRLYKLGSAGYWRLLLDVDDARSMGRAYRTAAALTQLDVQQVRQHEGTLKSLAVERAALEEQARKGAALRDQAVSTRGAMDRAVATHAALIASIDQRRDLTARLAGELAAAQQKLQVSIGQAGATPMTALPLRPFKGSLPWPAEGFVLTRFGKQRIGAGGTDMVRNGIEISLAEGQPVAAVHDGVVTYAAPFTGYGTLVIVDHGDGAHTLYGHLSSMAVSKGDRVQPRTRLGGSGRNPAGNPALYFELRVDGKPVDPLQWLKKQP